MIETAAPNAELSHWDAGAGLLRWLAEQRYLCWRVVIVWL